MKKKDYKLLVVDDYKGVLRSFEWCLKDNPEFKIDTAQSSDLAQRLASKNKYDMALIDYNLGPNSEDGVQCFLGMRRAGYSGAAYILSADYSSNTLFKALLSGVDGYISKNREIDYPTELACLIEAKSNGSSSASVFDIFLYSCGLKERDIRLLEQYSKAGFPDIRKFSETIDMTEANVWRRFDLIRKTLNLKNNYGLVQLLTVLSGFKTNAEISR